MKKLFQGVKSDIKFKTAGPGRRLNEEKKEERDNPPKEQPKARKGPLGDAQIAAASAAMARHESMQGQRKSQSKNAPQIHASKHPEGDQEVNITPSSINIPASETDSTSVCNVLFRCPLTGEIITNKEKKLHIRKSIEMLSHTDPISASIMMIYTLNKNQDKVKVGVETIAKYLNNIISNPTEEKYHTIKSSNKVFQEKVSCLEGSIEFFMAVGFEKTLPLPEQDMQHEFYVLSNKAAENLNDLQSYRDSLLNGEPIQATLERQPRIFAPSLQATRFSLTDDFYNLTIDEIKQEQQLRKKKLEQESQLRTKAMRERDEKMMTKNYKYTVLRVRFLDGYLLQGTFYAQESVMTLFDFVGQHLQKDWIPYDLIAPCGQKLENKNISFHDCGLVPSALLTFNWDAAVLADVEAAEGHKIENALKPELISSAETLN